MKKILFLIPVVVMLMACGGKGNNGKMSEADSLRLELGEKDALINEIFGSLGDITANLNQIKERENIVTATVDNGEIGREPTLSISEDIHAIDQLLQKNRETIAQLEKSAAQLKKANVKINSLEKLIAEMTAQVEAKDKEIAQLKKDLQDRDIRIEELAGRVEQLGSEVEDLTQAREHLESEVNIREVQLKTAYYIVGEQKDLIASDIVTKSGLFNTTLKFNENYGLENMTRVNADTFNEVLIGRKKASIVTPHPEGSYKLVMDSDGNYSSLVILDKVKFWELSKVLVVSYK